MNERLKTMTNEELFAAYQNSPSNEIKNELLERYLYIVKKNAVHSYHQYRNFMDVDDMIQEGVLELLKVIDRYDISLGIKFETYAEKRIRGLIYDQVRKQDWVPRLVRQESREIEKTIVEMDNELGREPHVQEVAQRMGLSVQNYLKKLSKAQIYSVVSLDAVLQEDNPSRNYLEPADMEEASLPEEALIKKELLSELTTQISGLKEKEKLLLSLYYKEGLTMREISEVMEISEARVSQIHSATIAKLKKAMLQTKKGE